MNIKALERKVEDTRGHWTGPQILRAKKAIASLRYGAKAYQKSPLPPMMEKNAQSSFNNGPVVTDNLGSWVKAGVMAGPFTQPPVKGFRANCLLAVVQKDKVRLVQDMSRPQDASFNSNIDPLQLEKVSMSSARQFSYSLKDAGVGAFMSKFDMKDAYKLIPCHPKDYRLQGLQWLDRFFIDTKMIFGASTAVANYDNFSRTVKDLALSQCDIPGHLVHRTLDDVPAVSPAHKSWGQDFAASYLATCQSLNIPLAQNCPKNEKAFVCQTKGRVLGIWFDSASMSWSYPQDKLVPLLREIQATLSYGATNLKQLQSIMGKINDVALMFPFLKAFRQPTNALIASFKSNEDISLPLTHRARTDLAIMARAMAASASGLPVVGRPSDPPIHHLKFTSDAAGAIMGTQNGVQVAVQDPLRRGVASIGHLKEGDIWFSSRLFWPNSLLMEATDSKGSHYGCKSTTLEMVGLLLPFISIPKVLAGQHVVLQVDNIGALFGWESRQVAGDISASILVRSLHLIEALLACKIYVVHLPRCSSPEGTLVDLLSRQGSTTSREKKAIRGTEVSPKSRALVSWLHNPSEDWDLALKITSDVEKLL